MFKSMNKYQYIIGLASIVLLISVALLYWSVNPDKSKSIENAYARLGGDFVLQSSEGPVSLSDYKDKIVVLYFGYAFCPDVCPTSLGLLSVALRKLEPAELDSIQAFFISVDPERDTVDKLKKYADAFHPSIKGITGTATEIAEIANRYGVAYMKVETPGSAMGYTVDHSSRYYLVGRDGKLKNMLGHGTSPEKIIEGLRSLL